VILLLLNGQTPPTKKNRKSQDSKLQKPQVNAMFCCSTLAYN